MRNTRVRGWLGWTAALLAAHWSPLWADVSIQQKTTLDVASLVQMHGATTTNVTSDKKREDTESHCEGMMSLLCGNVQGGEIVRLDRALTWHLEPTKKRYIEQTFATPEEMAALRARMQANLEKMRSCPVSQKQQPIDKSKCTMAPPKFDVHKTDEKMTFAGHSAQKTSATMTESCTDNETGDVCDTVVALEVWLTEDTLPGTADRRAFDAAYAKKLGLDDVQGMMRGEFAKFLAPYQSQIKALTDKSDNFKGQPLKTSFRVLMGGPQCKSKPKSGDSGGDSSAANPLADVKDAGKAIGAMMGGLFKKKKTEEPQDTAAAGGPAAGASAPGVSKTPDPFAQYVQLAAFGIETVSIDTDTIPAARFEVPPDWTKVVPKAAKGGDDEFTCPKS
jgi:hypothetical protein